MKKPKVQTPEEFYLGLLTRGTSQPFLMSSPYDENLRKTIQALAGNILDYIRSHIQTDKEEMTALLRPEGVVVTTIPQATVQAFTIWMDSVHSIAVNHGLMLFMYGIARALAPHIITRGPDDPPPPPESDAISIIATMIDWMSSPARAPLVQNWPTGQREIRTAENIATAGERFVVSHEIAHIMRRHLIVDASKIDSSKITPHDLDNRPYGQEIEADAIGAMLSIDSMSPQKLDPRAGAVGIVMFLHSLNLAEKVGAIVSDGKHPPAELRLEILWQTLPKRYGSDFATLTAWADEMGVLIARLGDEAMKERSGRRVAAIESMDRIFREHPGTQGFQRKPELDKAILDEVRQLMLSAPSAVLEAVARNLLNADEYRAAVSAVSSPAELNKDDRARRHSIAHFIARHLPANVRPVLGVDWVTMDSPGPKN